MKSKLNVLAIAGVGIGLLGGTAAATPATWDFTWQANTINFRLNTHDLSSSGTGGFEVEFDPGTGAVTAFDGPLTWALINTGYLISGTPVKARVVFDDVAVGSTFATTPQNMNAALTAHVEFSASGLFTPSTCQTSQFTFTYVGSYGSQVYSTAFTIPSLSGTGTQACGMPSKASDLNSEFKLGSATAKYHFDKCVFSP